MPSVAIKCRVTVHPDRTALHRTIKLQRTCPHLCAAGISLRYIWQNKLSVTLFGQMHATCKGTAIDRMCIIDTVDGRQAGGSYSTVGLYLLSGCTVYIVTLHP